MKGTSAFLTNLAGGVAALGFAGGVFAIESISPGSVSRTMNIGDSFTINKTVTLDPNGASVLDVFFLADNTSSMGGTISSAKNGALTLLNALPSTYRYGVGRYYGDPSEPGSSASSAYSLLTNITNSKSAVVSGINAWNTVGGGDNPEGNFYGLKQTAQSANWGAGSQRVVVWFGDSPSHTETTSQQEATDALKGVGAKVVAFNKAVAGSGIDGMYTGQPLAAQQASEIIARTGGSLTNSFTGLSDDAFVKTITEQISASASKVDLSFYSTYVGSGLGLSFACTDPLGCTDVKGGESRAFDLTIEALKPGSYDFSVGVRGVGALESDRIIVAAPVPEPQTYALMLAGLGMLGFLARRRVVFQS